MTNLGPDIAWVDTIDVCQLKCPTCMRGVRAMQNSSRKMSLDTFAAVVARLRKQGFHRLGLFNWTEPFLNRNIEDYVATAKKAGFWVTFSSTLSLRHIDNLEETLAAGVALLTVSISGIDQETYQINHVGGELKYVMHNLALVRDIIARRALSTRVDLRLLKFDYNAHQEPQLCDYAERMGFHFEPIDAVGHPKSNWLSEYNNERYVREAEAAADKPSPEDEGKACELMFNQIAIDCLGDVYICCAMPNYPSFIGRYF
jgi:MoaA/NifB/PqqE/SkfB family radical SAM enzyme